MPKWLTDSSIHEPPVTGLYHYTTWTPANGSFPAIGATYVDPVFGGTVRRLTNVGAITNLEDIYGHHWANADGTFVFSNQDRGLGDGNALYILNTATGAYAYSVQPQGGLSTDKAWHPTDPDKYYYMSGASLMRRNLAAQTDTTVKTFAASLQAVGGSENWFDKTGRYFMIKYSGVIHLWDSQTDTLYTGTFTPFGGSGWTGITPDGNYIIDVTGPSTIASTNAEHYAYAINHGTTTVNVGSPNQFWGLAADHGTMVSASDGKNYYVTFDDYDSTGLFRIDITLNQTGQTAAQQKSANQRLLTLPGTAGGHVSGVGHGAYLDWIFYSSEDNSDSFDEVPTGWYAYEQEIMAINLVTLEIRRLAHHRSRGIAYYYYQPRVSCSWDGSVVAWTSNFNTNPVLGYADLFVINNPLTAEASTTVYVPSGMTPSHRPGRRRK